MDPARSNLTATALVVAVAVVTVASGVTLGGVDDPLGVVSGAVPAGLLTLALTVSLVSGSFDVSTAGVLAITATFLSVNTMVTTADIVVTLIGVSIFGGAMGFVVARITSPFPLLFGTYFLLRTLAHDVFSRSWTSLPTRQSSLVRWLDADSELVRIGVLAAASAIVAALLSSTQLGLGMRAAADPETGEIVDAHSRRRLAIATTAITYALAATAGLLAFAHVGISGSESGDHALALSLPAIALATAGFSTVRPHPARAVAACLILGLLHAELVHVGWWSNTVDLIVLVVAGPAFVAAGVLFPRRAAP